MDIRTIGKVIRSYRAALAAEIDIDEIIVFGSHVEGTATEDSDLDVIVVSNDFAAMPENERLDLLEDAAEAVEPLLHPWGFTTEEFESASELTTLGYARMAGLRFR
jgi:predicted nucleotidyltransferase